MDPVSPAPSAAPAPAPSPAPAAPAAAPPPSAPDAPAPPPAADTRPRDAQGRFVKADGTLDPNQGPETPAEKAERLRFKVKVDDQELEVDDQELVRGYQRARAANQRFEEAARLHKEAQAERARINDALRRGRERPEEALAALGVDVQAFVEARLRHMLDEEALPEAERVRRQWEAERAEWQAQRDAWEQQQAQARHQAEVQHYQTRFRTEVPAALKAAGLPEKGGAAARLFDLGQAALAQGVSPDWAALAREVRAELDEDLRAYVERLDDDSFRRTVGEERLARIRQRDLAQLRGTPPAPAPGPFPKAPEPAARRVPWEQYLEEKYQSKP